jgi:hypothetical protein
MSIFRSKASKRSGYLFIAAGAIFFIVAAGGEQKAFSAFYGVGAAFIAIGAAHVKKSK